MLLSKLIKYPMKNRFFPVKQAATGNRQGWSWRSMRLLLLCGMGVLSSLTVVLSSTSWAQLPRAATIVAVQPVLVAQAAVETPAVTEAPAPGIPPRDRTSAPAKEDTLGPASKYILEFNRSPAMGNRFRMEGVYDESRLGFTRPRNWEVKGVKAIVRFQHSPALVASRSNLIVRINDTSIGTVPLNLQPGQIGEAIVTIPPQLIQDFNDITLVAQQENSPTCSKPGDKSLWTEVLPDSKVVFDYQPKQLNLDFGRYPYPFFDELALDTSRINYLQPAQVDAAWVTATSRLQTQMGRLADFRSFDTQLVKDSKNLSWNDRLVIIGTPDQQPLLKTMKLPLAVKGNQWMGSDGAAIPADEGVLMLAHVEDNKVPVLVISGNSPEAIQKAAQYLINTKSANLGTSALIQVKGELPALPSVERRTWSRFLPPQKQFQLKDMQAADGKNYGDVTVRGSDAPPVSINFWALPDDRFLRGSSMTLHYGYSAQADPRKSTVTIDIDGVTIGSKKLDSDQGADRQSFTVDLPESAIKSNAKLQVNFKLVPKDDADGARACGRLTDQHLSGTVYGDTEFAVNREIGADLPNLKLLTSGYPLADMQDLSRMAIVLPDAPTAVDLMTMLKFSERMGRISRAATVEHQVYIGGNNLTNTTKENKHIVAIGTGDRFPVKEVFSQGLGLMDSLNRQFGKTQVRTLPNADGVIKSVISPWNRERLLLALTGQSERGLKQVQDVLSADPWFYQLQGDTALMTPTTNNPSPYDPNGYQFQFLQESAPKTLENLNPLNKVMRFLQSHFYLLPIGIIAVSLLMYGIAQRYLKRVAEGQ
jgi:cellulose synthase operon protein B